MEDSWERITRIVRVNGKPLNIQEQARRHGDPPMLISIADAIKHKLHWSPRYDNLDVIVKTALDWEYKLLKQL